MQQIAILVIDLSGYETMPNAALISSVSVKEEYIALVYESLCGSCELIKQQGNQLIIGSPCTEDVAKLVIDLYGKVALHEHFLAVQAGLHYGDVELQGNHYFGTSINIAARIASRARGGIVLASQHFIYNLAHPESFHYIYHGQLRFKDLFEAVVIVELLPEYNIVAAPDYSNPLCKVQQQDNLREFKYNYAGKVSNFYSRVVGKITMQRLLNFSRSSAQWLA